MPVPVNRVAKVVGLSALAVFVLTIAGVSAKILPSLVVVAMACFVVVGVSFWALVTVWTHEWRPSARQTFWIRAAMIALAILSPLAVVLSLRLSFESCFVLNPLGLPWPDATKTAVRIASALVLIGSIASIVFGFQYQLFRGAAIFVAVYLPLMAFPTFIGLFLTVYGDPAANCVPG